LRAASFYLDRSSYSRRGWGKSTNAVNFFSIPEMVAAGVRVFVGGLRRASSAKSLRAHSDDKVLITDGPYLETKEHIGGFWVLEAADMDAALEWGRKAAVACRALVEVRPFY
jgi:hypothetical protein